MRDKNERKLDILMVGPFPPPIGGTTVLFQHIVSEMDTRPDIRVAVVPTWPPQGGTLAKVLPAFKVMLHTLAKARDVSLISFFACNGGLVLWAPFLHLAARMLGKPWILRVFGGGCDLAYEALPGLVRAGLRRTSLSADVVLFETKYLVDYFSAISGQSNISWHSNFRPFSSREDAISRKVCRRFVFISHVKPSKGIYEILKAGELLEADTKIDVFGPLQDSVQEKDFRHSDQVSYRGILPSEDVIPTLRGYDALLLPTYYEDEGYPGIVLEAYSVGMPVIASRWRAIPEIVDETSGILVTPGDASDLASAMSRLIKDERLYQTLCQGAWEKRKDFSLELWTDKFIDYCEAAISGERSRYANRDQANL